MPRGSARSGCRFVPLQLHRVHCTLGGLGFHGTRRLGSTLACSSVGDAGDLDQDHVNFLSLSLSLCYCSRSCAHELLTPSSGAMWRGQAALAAKLWDFILWQTAMRYDLTDLRLFVNVIEAGTITGGARATYLSVAAASERIKGMEDALGAPLIVRGRKSLSLTDAGSTVLRHGRAILQQMRLMQGDLQEQGSEAKARVRLLCNTSAVSEHLPRLVAGFLQAHRGLSIDLEERSSQDIADAIRDEACDLGVLSDAADTAGLECQLFRHDPLVLVVPREQALASRRSVSIAELPTHEFVGLGQDSALQQLIERQTKRSGRRIAYRMRVRSLENVCAVVGQGIGVGIVPAAVAARMRRSAGIREVKLQDAWSRRSLLMGVRQRDGLPTHVKKLLAYLVSASTDSPGSARHRH